MKNYIIIIGAALVLAASSQAQPVPCPDCPPCTNCPPYTNAPFVPAEFPTNALLVREAQISTAGTIIYVGQPWVLDTNNLLIYGGGQWTNAPTDTNWTYVLAVTNTSPFRAYTLEYRSSLAAAGTNITDIFVGATNGVELLFTNTVAGQLNNGFWLVNQVPGFISYGTAGNKAQGMGQFFGCPSVYQGYVDWTNGPIGGQYHIDTNVINHTVTDFLEPTNHLQLFGDNRLGCDIGSVTLTNNRNNTLFTAWPRVFHYLNFPTNQTRPLLFQGFLEN